MVRPVRTKKKLRTKQIDVHFNKYFSPEFFAWLIPQVNEYGLITSVRPADSLRYFKRKLNLPEGRVYSGFVPVGFCSSVADRAMLLGDACGQAKPLTGGGIIFSLRAARHAARVIKTAAASNRFSSGALLPYENAWKRELANEIRLQLVVRHAYRKFTNRDIDKLFVKFGHGISQVRDFDYDRLSTLSKGVSKLQLLRYMLPRIGTLF